jgi:hypothetical protein
MLRSAALAHGAPLPGSLRPPRERMRRSGVNGWSWMAGHDA